jgi:hypothetical protein
MNDVRSGVKIGIEKLRSVLDLAAWMLHEQLRRTFRLPQCEE